MGAGVKEKRVLKKIRRALVDSVGGSWKKIHGGVYQDRGILDLIGCVKGSYIEIEVKTPRRLHEVSELQMDRILEVKKNGGLAFVTCNPEHAVGMVKSFLRQRS